MSDVKETIFEHDTHVVPSTAASLATFAVLAILAVLALGVGFSNVGQPMKLVASLMIATLQVSIVAIFFMDLRQADKLTWLVAGASIFWVGIMFTFTLTDYLTRQFAAF